MKKYLLFLVFVLLAITGIAQTKALNKTPEQLATEMTTAIANDVTLTQQQQAQIIQVATTYFSNLRTPAQRTIDARVVSYDNFQQALQTIMTPEIYVQWREIIRVRMQQRIESALSKNQ